MKCRICGKTAMIELRQHNIALCRDDFRAFFERRVEKTIREHALFAPGERIAVAVSGGKDSLALMHVLSRLGYAVAGIYVDLGIDGYSDLSREKCRSFSVHTGEPIHAFPVAAFFGMNIRKLSLLTKRNSCSICGIVKRYVMNRFTLESGYATLATGHNLDDESAALLGNLINFDRTYLSKEKIVLPAKEKTARKVKPLSLITEREIAAYAIMNGIDYIYDECPFSKGATSLNYKHALNMIEERSPGTKQRFIARFMENADVFRDVATGGGDDEIKRCATCGYLTYRDECNFCILAGKASAAEKMRGDLLDHCTQLAP